MKKIKVKNQACGGRRYGVWRSIFPPSSLLCSYPGILPAVFVSKFVKLSNFASKFENLARLLGAVRKMEVWWGGPASSISFCHLPCQMKDPGVQDTVWCICRENWNSSRGRRFQRQPGTGLQTGNRKQVSDDIDSLMSLSRPCILPIWAPFTLGWGCVICLPYVLRGNCLFNGKTISIVPCQTPPRGLWWMAPACSLLWERCTLLTGDCSLSPNLSARFNKFIFLNQTLLAEHCQKWINQAGELQRGIILSRGLSSW